MRVLSITSLFPDSTRKYFAPFNLRQIVAISGLVGLRLIVPVPWPRALMVRFSGRKLIAPEECRGLFPISYPVYFYLPGFLRSSYGMSYYLSIRSLFRSIVDEFKPEIVYSTWAYPDSYSAYLAAKKEKLPLVIRVHGSDINEYMKDSARKKRILEAISYSSGVIVVSKALRELLAGYGVDEGKLHLVYNGIERDLFKPGNREAARVQLGIDIGKKVVLYAGNLKWVKGVDLLIRAFAGLKKFTGVELHIIGDGPMKRKLISMIGELGLRDRVFVHGAVEHRMVALWLSACDVLCLPSRAEGTPNIVLEALASARPVVAADVGGVSEIVSRTSGIIFPPGSPDGCEVALRKALSMNWNESEISCPAPSWEENAHMVVEVFNSAVVHNSYQME